MSAIALQWQFQLLHHPDCCRVMYCYSTFLFHYSYYSSSSTHVCPLDFSEMPCSIPSTCGSPLQSFNELYIVRWNIDREQMCVNQYLCVYVSIKIQSILIIKELVPTNLELNIKAYIPPGPVLSQLDPALELSNFGCSSTHNHTLHVLQRTIGLCAS